MVTRARNECPWIRELGWPGGAEGRKWAASKQEFLIDTHGAGLGDFQEANQGPEVLTQAEQLVGLQAQAPFGMGETIIDGHAHIVRGLQRALIHGLQQEMGEV